MKLIKKWICLFDGHPTAPTGKHLSILSEVQCTRCGGIFIHSQEHGRMLLPCEGDLKTEFYKMLEERKVSK